MSFCGKHIHAQMNQIYKLKFNKNVMNQLTRINQRNEPDFSEEKK